MKPSPILLAIGALGLVALAALVQAKIGPERERVRQIRVTHLRSANQRLRRETARQIYATYLPRAAALKWLCLGNRNVAADYVLFRSLAYVSLEFPRGGEKMEWLEKMYDVIIELDPDWQNMYIMAAWMLSGVNQRPRAALRFLDQAGERWPDTYRYVFEAGMICLMTPHLRSRTAEYFRRAAEKSDCPFVIQDVAHRILQEFGHLDSAITLTRRQLALLEAGSPLFVATLRSLREYETRLLVKTLRGQLTAFHAAHGTWPPGLQALVRADPAVLDQLARELSWPPEKTAFLLARPGEVPRDACGLPLLYDRRTGQLESTSLLILVTHRLATFLNRLADRYEDRYKRPPPSLDSSHGPGQPLNLIEEIRLRVPIPRPDEFIQFLGPDLEIPQFPFGFALPFDSATGRIVLPQGRRLEDLDRAIGGGRSPPQQRID